MTISPVRPQGVDEIMLARFMSGHTAGASGRIILADGHDARAITAAGVLNEIGMEVILVGEREDIEALAFTGGVTLTEATTIMNTAELREGAAGAHLTGIVAKLGEAKTAGWMDDPLSLAVAAVPAGLAVAAVAGATRPTSDVLRAALRIVGTHEKGGTISSSFLMRLNDGRYVGYGDCAVIPTPNSTQLAQIATSTAHTFATLTGEEPAVAMLSFSTAGSAEHESISAVRAATTLARVAEPTLQIDGELQFDAALLESVAVSKAPASSVAGHANVFIFPNLAAGNIGYKITQRLAGAQAYGPILQGLAAPINDLSRGATVADIVNVSLISMMQSQKS
ncbi:phosphotransacetylase [Paeniglutamicibacter gangotriensis]|uniref:Phosphotransacetylase n=1 Tax=Paeniglutamicibacter gangotriensis Lz1y TaxID=1276920 RepID=M7MQV2_9MICC|nr:phosphotransacetylase [Paeniglutamicibacter gangotriensis]EMQ97290.1 phosphotransacetylase [Paeniglutamicibacter gangotriensis Lz1y]